jgi:hypothetical protein
MATRKELHAALDRVLDDEGMEGTASPAEENEVHQWPNLPLMTPTSAEMARRTGNVVRWQDTPIETHEWAGKYGVNPFRGARDHRFGRG